MLMPWAVPGRVGSDRTENLYAPGVVDNLLVVGNASDVVLWHLHVLYEQSTIDWPLFTPSKGGNSTHITITSSSIKSTYRSTTICYRLKNGHSCVATILFLMGEARGELTKSGFLTHTTDVRWRNGNNNLYSRGSHLGLLCSWCCENSLINLHFLTPEESGFEPPILSFAPKVKVTLYLSAKLIMMSLAAGPSTRACISCQGILGPYIAFTFGSHGW